MEDMEDIYNQFLVVLRLKDPLKFALFLHEYGIDVNTPIASGNSMLKISLLFKEIDACSMLLDFGADPKETYGFGKSESLLHIAARHDDLFEIIGRLIDGGANVNGIDARGRTPLFSAISMSSKKNLKYLLEMGADISHKDNKGVTPLEYSVANGTPGVTSILLEHARDCMETRSFTKIVHKLLNGINMDNPSFKLLSSIWLSL